MAQVITTKKRIHKECGDGIELIALRESFRYLIACKKCGEKWKMPLDDIEEGNAKLLDYEPQNPNGYPAGPKQPD